jgi:hypothetical protein
MAPNTKTSIMTGSGRYFDPYNPTPESVHLPDIARGLRRGVASRFNGQLLDPAECPHPQSGASHSMRVARLVHWRLTPAPGMVTAERTRDQIEDTVATVFAALIHDAPEGYLGDALGPIKNAEQETIEAVVLAAIAERLVGPTWAPIVCGLVHNSADIEWADKAIALRQEALLYQPGAEDWAQPVTSIEDCVDIVRTLHLFHPREGEDWEATVRHKAGLLAHIRTDQRPTETILAELAWHLT